MNEQTKTSAITRLSVILMLLLISLFSTAHAMNQCSKRNLEKAYEGINQNEISDYFITHNNRSYYSDLVVMRVAYIRAINVARLYHFCSQEKK